MHARSFALIAVGICGSLLAAYVAVFCAVWSQPIERTDALAEVHRVKTELARDASSPKWLIVGGSSAWFGFDSELLAREVGRPVVNLGTHAALPLWFQLEHAETMAQPGDTVLLAAELVHYWEQRANSYGVAKLGVLAPDAFSRASWRRRLQLLGGLPPSHVLARALARMKPENFAVVSTEALMRNLRARWAGTYTGEVPGYYNYLELTPKGDFARPREAAVHPPDDYGLDARHEWPSETWREIAASAQRLSSRGVRCVFTWPPFEQRRGESFDSPLARENVNTIRERLGAAGWRELGQFEDAVFASAYFYDTAYHLTTDGARERTRRVAEATRTAGLAAPE